MPCQTLLYARRACCGRLGLLAAWLMLYVSAVHSQPTPGGRLGAPLGKIVVASGVVAQESTGKRSDSLAPVLQVETVDGHALPQPVTLPFTIFTTASVAKPLLGRRFQYTGYETGAYTGVPPEAFKIVPAIASKGHHFETSFTILREELARVHNTADVSRLAGQRVEVIGQYIAQARKPDPATTGIAGFKGDYLTAVIELSDGAKVALYPRANKQSLRAPDEVQAHAGKRVRVTGTITSTAEGALLTAVDGIWGDRE